MVAKRAPLRPRVVSAVCRSVQTPANPTPKKRAPSRITLTALLALFVMGLGGAWAQSNERLVGDWRGTIELPGSPLEIAVSFGLEAGVLAGTIDIPAQGAQAVPLERVALAGDALSFAIAGVPGEPTFTGTLKGARIAGTFSQSGGTFPFTLTPGLLEAATRPQDPVPPYPYLEEEVSYTNGEVTLAGTLTLPEGEGPFPALLLLSGSGAQDRNATLAGHRPFLVLADFLSRAGYAVLRVDDRGVGGSSGDLTRATYADLAADAGAGVSYLKSRDEIDGARTGLLGHSEGGSIAPLAAAETEVAFVVLLAAPALPGDEVLSEQNRLLYEQAGASREAVEAQLGYLQTLAAALQGEDYERAAALTKARIEEEFVALPTAQRPSPERQRELIEAQVAAVATPYVRSLVLYDPQSVLEHLRAPVLALFGSEDVQVSTEKNVPAMRSALADNPDAAVEVFGGLNHLMQPAQTGTVDEYAQLETTLEPAVLERIVGWLEARF